MAEEAEALLHFWFGTGLDSPEAVGPRIDSWFTTDARFDETLRARFGELLERADRGELEGWRAAPSTQLALILVHDQLPRNLFRGTPAAWSRDAKALALAREAIERGDDERLHPLECVFLYLPLEHAEDLEAQEECVRRYQALVERAPDAMREIFESFVGYAERHRVVIERFGRFPHRNEALGRESSPEERRYLAEGGETFSGGSETSNGS